MWALIVFMIAVVALTGYVWVRQRRHPVASGKHSSAEVELENRGSFWGKSAGGGGYAINLGGDADTLEVEGREAVGMWRAPIEDPNHPGRTHPGPSHRHFCTKCGTALWAEDPCARCSTRPRHRSFAMKERRDGG